MAITRSFKRGLVVLELLASSGGDSGAGVTELAAAADLDKATTSRLLQTLCAMSYAYQDPETRNYKLTGRLLSVADSHLASLDLPQRAQPYLAEVRAETGETVHLGVRELDRVVYVAKLESHQTVHIASAIGQTMPLHTTALGKAILAAMDTEERANLSEALDLAPRTERSITTTSALMSELCSTAERGFAIDDRENEDAICCVAAAVVDSIGRVVGAISVSGPAYRMEDHLDDYGEVCRKAATGLGASI